MEKLIQQLKVILGTNFGLYFKSHSFHWNIEGADFVQYHTYLDGFYNAVWANTDLIAEKISEDIRGRIQDLTVNQLLFINETITTSIRGQGDRSKDKKSDSMGSAVKRRDKESYQ